MRRWGSVAAAAVLPALALGSVVLLPQWMDPPPVGADQIVMAGGPVLSLAWSPDGRQLAAGVAVSALDAGGGARRPHHEAQLWNAETLDRTHTLEGHTARVTALAFSANGKVLATGSRGEVKLWDSQTGALLRTLTAHRVDRALIAFRSDGRMVATWSGDRLNLWNVQTGALEWTLPGFGVDSLPSAAFSSGSLPYLAFSPDRETLAATRFDRLRLWNPRSGETKLTPTSNCGQILSVAFSPDGRTLACGVWDGTVVLWDVNGGGTLSGPRQRLRARSHGVGALAFSDDGRLLAGAGWSAPGEGSGAEIRVWDLDSGALRQRLDGHEDRIRSLAFRPGGGYPRQRAMLASGSDDGTIRFWCAP
jgi:WD40 repeat protein